MPLYVNGKYLATCTEYQWGKSAAGKERIECMFQLDEGPNAGEFIREDIYLTPNAFKWSCDKLKALGWNGVALDDLGSLDKQVRVVLKDEVYTDKEGNAKPHTRIDRIYDLSPRTSTSSMSREDIENFAEKMHGRLETWRNGSDTEGDNGTPF